jgi:hypothetical protein
MCAVKYPTISLARNSLCDPYQRGYLCVCDPIFFSFSIRSVLAWLALCPYSPKFVHSLCSKCQSGSPCARIVPIFFVLFAARVSVTLLVSA